MLAAFLWSCGPSEQELFDEGVKMLESSNYEKSLDYFERTLKKNPENISAWNAKGITLLQLGKHEEAIKAFNESLALDSTSYKPFFNRGNVYFEKKLYKEAVQDYNRANGLDPTQLDIYYNRAISLMALEQYEDAIFDFEAVLQGNPNHAQAQFNKGKAELANNDPVSAVQSLFKAVALDDKNADAYYLLGVTQMSAFGQKEDGCANLKMALSLGNAEAQTWVDDFCKN